MELLNLNDYGAEINDGYSYNLMVFDTIVKSV